MAKKLTEVLSAETLALVTTEIASHENVSLLVNETVDGKTTYVPLERLSAVTAEKHALKEENTTLTTSLEGLKQGNTDNKDLQAQIAWYETTITELKTANSKVIDDLKFDTKFDLEILKLKPVVNVKAVKALFDKDKISLDGENFIGFNDQATSIMEANKALFEVEKEGLPTTDKGKPAGGTVINPFAKETKSIIGQIKLKQTDLALYTKLKQEASAV